jgi:putative flippase GtrA/GT2 family glycosyltransferase
MFPLADESGWDSENRLVMPQIKLPMRLQQMPQNIPTTPRTDISLPVMPQSIPITPRLPLSLPVMPQSIPITPRLPLSYTKKRRTFHRLYSRLPKRIFGFSLVGGSVMLGGITLLFVLVQFLHIEKHLAYLIQAIASIEANFFLNRFLNWKERDGNLVIQWLKFHSTSAITFPFNQALFAFLTWLGVQYLIVTMIGVGIAAIVNYLANDRFVFHRQDFTKRETERVPTVKPLVQFPHVGVVIPVRNSQRTIRTCLSAVLEQQYPGQISVFLVGNIPEQDASWNVLGDYLLDKRIHCIQIRRPGDWVGRDANIKRYCGCDAAIAAGVDVLALLDSQVMPPSDWIMNSVHFLHRYHVDGVAGRSYSSPDDHSFPAIYQNHSLFSEWPSFGEAFFLTQDTFGKAKGLPVTNNLLITRQVWEHIHRQWPLKATYSWEDFRLAWEIARAGYSLCCTDKVYVYRNHKPKFRLVKHIAAGAGSVTFYHENPDCTYVRRMLLKGGLVTASACLLVILLITTAVLGNIVLLKRLV